MSGDLEHPEFDTYDEGRLSERIMLAAAAYDLGSAIGWFRDAAAEEAKRLLAYPERTAAADDDVHRVRGHEARAQRQRPAQPRKPLDEIVHRERW